MAFVHFYSGRAANVRWQCLGTDCCTLEMECLYSRRCVCMHTLASSCSGSSSFLSRPFSHPILLFTWRSFRGNRESSRQIILDHTHTHTHTPHGVRYIYVYRLSRHHCPCRVLRIRKEKLCKMAKWASHAPVHTFHIYVKSIFVLDFRHFVCRSHLYTAKMCDDIQCA